MAKQLLDRQAADLVSLRQSGSGALAQDLEAWGLVAAAGLSVRRAAAGPADAGSISLLREDLQASAASRNRVGVPEEHWAVSLGTQRGDGKQGTA